MGFPLPPITQWRIGPTIYNDLAAAERDLDGRDLYGRRRLNDYVGSPHWGPWEVIIVEIRADGRSAAIQRRDR